MVICHKCNEVHTIIELSTNLQAHCNRCNAMLYKRSDDKMIDRLLAITISAIIFFIIANSFTIIKIELMDNYENLNILSMLFRLFDMGYYIVAIFITIFIFIVPLLSIFLYLFIAIFLKMKILQEYTKEMLVLISTLRHWNMLDIFLISVLVALVKLIDSFDISLDISFYSLSLFILLDIYIINNIKIFNLWQIYDKAYSEK
ncbi:Paraquat-inducible protein A [hydrothermal vent metagenome]|uniref:Paraquat-inducible protein A n=1 Tax=hydrothermal vent metagenome TaxID=652676 RepID=A0A1W1EIQ5_9ZZZZ